MGGGFYCGLLQNPSKESQSLYVMNAFFMEMRGKFVAPESSIVCYEIQWDPIHLSWSDFRNQLLGPTDPSKVRPFLYIYICLKRMLLFVRLF